MPRVTIKILRLATYAQIKALNIVIRSAAVRNLSDSEVQHLHLRMEDVSLTLKRDFGVSVVGRSPQNNPRPMLRI
jgi:hypothetical protein